MNELEKIPFKILEEKFRNFISDPNNKQVLFSGSFGSGKTTFLKDFFTERDSEYECIHIYPVNYPLHSNTDIYEILKYDLILDLIGKGSFESPDISSLMAYKAITTETAENILTGVLSIFSKTGRQLKELIDLIGKSGADIEKKIKELQDPLLGVRSFEDIISKIKGYEYDDYVTTLIRDKLELFTDTKKTVLIVDDLDRIDPEHLFRIISVFSAHIDYNTGDNKFGFDKILFVGDIENIKSMFVHKFGVSSSFNGYITKLSSKQPFYFDPANELYRHLFKILAAYRMKHFAQEGSFLPFEQKTNFELHRLLIYLFANLINIGTINLRDLENQLSNPIQLLKDGYIPKLDINYFENDLYIVYLFLRNFLNSNTEIIEAVEKIKISPLPLDSIFANARNYPHIYSNISAIPLNSLGHLPQFKSAKENTHFLLTTEIQEFSIYCYNQNSSRRFSFRLADESANAENLISILTVALKDIFTLMTEED